MRSGVVDPFVRVIEALRARGVRFKSKRDSDGREAVRAVCPAHTDRNPSLVVTRGVDRALIKCFGGCRTEAVLAQLGLMKADLFAGPPDRREPPRIIATYDYYRLDGTLTARKVRSERKKFRWQSRAGNKWRWGCDEAPGLYRWPELVGRSAVFVVEGEKAVDLLWSLGLPATCGPNGASSWAPQWSLDLQAAGTRSVAVLADNDQAGRRHAERVAASLHELSGQPIAVRVVLLPDLAPRADVVDWLTAGHDVTELDRIVAATPLWSPGATERARLKHRQALTLARVRKHRAIRRTVTHRMSAVTHRTSEPVVTRNAVTPPNVLQILYEGSHLDSDADDDDDGYFHA